MTWETVEPVARQAFDVWFGQPELKWARQAWNVLEQAGLADYDTGFDEYRAWFRLLVLAGIYHDFCDATWEEATGYEYWDWAESIEEMQLMDVEDVNEFVIGQLYARLENWKEDCNVTPRAALETLVESEREAVVRALMKGFNGDKGLYESLWLSRRDADEEEEVEEESGVRTGVAKTELIILGMFEGSDPWTPMTHARSSGFSWVSEGCQRR